jgi:DNA adenine methylase
LDSSAAAAVDETLATSRSASLNSASLNSASLNSASLNSAAANNAAGNSAEYPSPFLKWAGGKRQSLPLILAHLPSRFNRYFEPMVGAGALYFALKGLGLARGSSLIGDINPELINVYQVIKKKLEYLIPLLDQHQRKHSSRYFYKLRSADRDPGFWSWSSVERAARFIYLNKTCFNGLYRVNSRGEFNVPYGDYKRPSIFNERNLRLCHAALGDTQIEVGGFEALASCAQRDDLVYFDPPYEPLSRSSNFTSYAKEGFNSNDQIRLAEVFIELDRLGVKVLASNSSAALIYELYRGFNIQEVSVGRAINSKGSKRGKVKELLISNY